MTEPGPLFRVALRGYDPAQVERRVEELTVALHEAARQRDDLAMRLQAAEHELVRRDDEATALPTFQHLGERVAQILALAEEEATELRKLGAQEVADKHHSLNDQVDKIRSDADRYAEGRRRDADTEAARIVEDARRQADERLDAAERDAAARLQEAEALYEEQRARAAKAATDFETTLSKRRAGAEAEFTARLATSAARLDEAVQALDKAQADAEALEHDATREARRILEEADAQAAAIVTEAKTTAGRVRADSERELAAATQRRDSINAQLANVRQMLVTLTGMPTPVVPSERVAVAKLEAVELPGLVDLPEQADRSHDTAQLDLQ